MKPSRLLRAFRRRLFARARKLKPIGIGIAALLAISLSYVGVKALTKPSVKPPTIIAQPAPAAAPQIATATEETAAPGLTLTNPPSVPEAAQNVAPPTQSPETAPAPANAPPPASARSAPRAPAAPKPAGEPRQRRSHEFEGGAPGEDAIGNAGAAQKQDAAEQSTSRTQPGQPQIAAKPEPENPSNASRGTRSGDASPPEPLEQEAVPQFPWPPPKASASATIPRELLLNSQEHPKLGDAVAALDLAFRKAGYGERSYYSVPGGFAMASRIEQVNHDGTPKGPADRWSLEVPPMREFSLSAYMSALFTARSGYYRVIVFVVTSHPFRQASAKVTSEQAGFWSSRGLNELPEYFAQRDYTSAHRCTALIYEFKRTGTRHAEFVDPSEITGQIHLEKSGLLAAFAKRR